MYIELQRIHGDIYVNGQKIAFGVDFKNPPVKNPGYANVDWLLGWAKLGMLSQGHTIPHFQIREIHEFLDTQAAAPVCNFINSSNLKGLDVSEEVTKQSIAHVDTLRDTDGNIVQSRVSALLRHVADQIDAGFHKVDNVEQVKIDELRNRITIEDCSVDSDNDGVSDEEEEEEDPE